MATATLSFFPTTTTTRTNFKQFSPLFSKTNPTSFNPNISISSKTFLFTPPKPTFLPVTKSSETEAPVVEAEFEPETALTQIAETSEEEAPKPEQIFAVVMIGSRQYIVFPGRFLVTQRLKGASVNDKIILNKVLLVGTKTTTYIGQPVVTNAVVHAVVEDVGLNPKVIVFKYKKRKHYKRNIGHRQPNTRIRITGITGYQDYPADTLESAKEHAQKALRERELERAR